MARIIDFELNNSLSGLCDIQANVAYHKFYEGSVGKIQIQLIKNDIQEGYRNIFMKKYVDHENPGTCSNHKVLINWKNEDKNQWLIIDPTYHAISIASPCSLDFKTYMRKLVDFYLETPDCVRISWKLEYGEKPINQWMHKNGEIIIEWSEIIC